MEDNLKPLECSDKDVLSFGDRTYKVGVLKQAMNNSFNKNLNYSLRDQLERNGVRLPKHFNEQEWFDEGIDCEVLNLGSTEWKKGKAKVKFSVEFYVETEEDEEILDEPEINEPESPLDDLRKEFNQES
ncbi:MAG: KGK family protein [Okeania sp. SIO2H7]|nr:KGK family protein [Okeania sp. SIO2H7]